MKIEHIKDTPLIFDEIIINEYLPIKIILQESEIAEEKLYYQYIDSSDSIIEIAIDKKTLQILDISFVGINKIENNNIIEPKNCNNIWGTPVLKKSIFEKESYITDDKKMEIFKSSEKEIYAKFNKKDPFQQVIVSSHLSLYLDNTYDLCLLKVSDFSNLEWNKLLDIINWNI